MNNARLDGHRIALAGWLDERPGWPGAQITPALFLNQRGQRLSAKGAHDGIGVS